MKIAAKLIAIFACVIVVVLIVEQYLHFQHEIDESEKITREMQEEWAHDVREILTAAKKADPTTDLDELLASLSKSGAVNIRWVWHGATQSRRTPTVSKSLEELVNMAGYQTTSFSHQSESGELLHVTCIELDFDPAVPQTEALEFIKRMNYSQTEMMEALMRFAALAGTTLLTGALLVFWIGVPMITRPMNEMIEATRRVGQGDLSGRLDTNKSGEFGDLADSHNAMCIELAKAQKRVQEETEARVAATEQLRHAERLNMVGRLASGIAHELGTPLNVVSGRAQLIASGKLSAEEVQKSARIIKTETDRVTKIIRQLLDFARRNTPHKQPSNLQQIARQSIELIDPLTERQNYTWDLREGDAPITANVDSGQIQQVFMNLMVNAAQSMPEGGPIEIEFRLDQATPPEGHAASAGTFAIIHVRDHGTGIAEENREHIFEPFFTTKETGEGTGLGLSISYGIVEEHGGWIDVESEVGKGSCFTAYLPVESTYAGKRLNR